MKLPRDLAGAALVSLLRRYGYEVTHQTGSHAAHIDGPWRGAPHNDPTPSALRVGTLSAIVAEVATYLETSREKLAEDLFDR